MSTLLYGLITGILFGFLLQKGRVLRYDKQLGALRLMDMTIVKFMLSSIMVSMVGIYFLLDLGQVKLSIKETELGANILGGLIFGLGWGLFGYCPGTAVGAIGEGRWDAALGDHRDARWGRRSSPKFFPALKSTVLTWGNLGKITLPQVVGLNHWPIISFSLSVAV